MKPQIKTALFIISLFINISVSLVVLLNSFEPSVKTSNQKKTDSCNYLAKYWISVGHAKLKNHDLNGSYHCLDSSIKYSNMATLYQITER